MALIQSLWQSLEAGSSTSEERSMLPKKSSWRTCLSGDSHFSLQRLVHPFHTYVLKDIQKRLCISKAGVANSLSFTSAFLVGPSRISLCPSSMHPGLRSQ